MAGNLGRAVASIGDDVSRFSIEASRDRRERDLADLRDRRERDIAELKAELAALRATSAGGRGSGGLPPVMQLPAGESQLLERAVSGLPGSRFDAAAEYLRTGREPQMPNPGTDPDGQPIPHVATPGDVVADPQATQRVKADLPAYGRGVMATRLAPQASDDFQRGLTAATARDDVYQGTDVAEAGRRAAAVKGEGAFRHSNSDVTRDEFTGDTEMTPLGTARADAAKALERDRDASARKDDRTDPNRPRGGGKDDGDLTDKELNDAIGKQNQAVSNARGALKEARRADREDRQRELREAIDRLNALQSIQNERARGNRDAKMPPGGRPRPAPAPAPGNRPPLSSFLK